VLFSKKTETDNQPSLLPARVFWKWVKVIVIVLAITSSLFVAGCYAASQIYVGAIAPGINIGTFNMAGMSSDEAKDFLYSKTDALLEQGLDVIYKDETTHIRLSSFGTEDPDLGHDYITYEIDQAVDVAYQTYHHDNPFVDAFLITAACILRPDYIIPTTINIEAVKNEILSQFPELAESPVNAGFVITNTEEGWVIDVSEDNPGTVFEQEVFIQDFGSMVIDFDLRPITLEHSYTDAEVESDQVQALVYQADKVLSAAPYTLKYKDLSWELTAETIALALEPQIEEGVIQLGLNQEAMQDFIDTLALEIEIEAQDAHFTMSESRVTDFVSSHDGLEIVQEETLQAITNMWHEETLETEIITTVTKPLVVTSEVNDLGISEILGTGTSSFRGSPYNRVMNIKHGAEKLNGLLIAPGEEFSLLERLKPFTIADGYLPELVIRGDEIVPEVGGGLCQIGTTTFRTAMNSAMPITQRSNHSLVVSYYNDPSNGNPGTDATIYDPAPDLRFLNDSDNHILFTADVDTDTYTLTFTFWGTNDGRNGYYSAPVVTSWIPYGETQYVDTEDLEPGEEECQGAHIGANANFTYYLERPDGSVEETYYESHYRPLAEICLVGTDPDEQTEEELEEEMEEDLEEIVEQNQE
jgi:vancomycin resistance protein YoaR